MPFINPYNTSFYSIKACFEIYFFIFSLVYKYIQVNVVNKTKPGRERKKAHIDKVVGSNNSSSRLVLFALNNSDFCWSDNSVIQCET